ncbi:hypothetical protein MVEN_01872500 [Mycena venus]|uniref:Uncharacterized protein n=1 Tax=Mycena venus TaxID=2733690 RepID=A0A8H6XJ97_9AGAR|nr:hypothetical protein MVEN_01872500 [Mycena venus]
MSSYGEDSTDTLLNSAISLLGMSHKAPKRSWFTTSKALRLSSLILHSTLVVIHLVLFGIWARRLEHQFTVALENQNFASFLITATSTAFGTIYFAILVFVTQTLSMRRSLQMDQVLTATHDNAAAWAGIGAALLHLWYQKAVRASIGWTLTAALYLMTISVLHITMSSLFSLVTFNSSRSFLAATRGLPSFNGTVTPGLKSSLFEMETYAPGSLYFLPSVLEGTTNLGLQDGSLYDVLDINVPSGNATVDASGFNITCGSIPEEERSTFVYRDGVWQNSNYTIHSTQVGMIPAIRNPDWYSIVLYSTIPIVDSSGKSESWVDWANWYNSMPGSDFEFDYSSSESPSFTTVADVYLIQKLNLPAANHSDTQNVTLHDLENALSTLVASMFWTLGHIPPTHRPPPFGVKFQINDNGTIGPSLSDVPTPPILLPGKGEVTEIFAETRAELNIIAVSAGLAASMILTMLASASLLFQRGQNEDDLLLDGTGILHAIWLYRSHPELEKLLEQVEHPTDENLRAAGMVKARLVNKQARKDAS